VRASAKVPLTVSRDVHTLKTDDVVQPYRLVNEWQLGQDRRARVS